MLDALATVLLAVLIIIVILLLLDLIRDTFRKPKKSLVLEQNILPKARADIVQDHMVVHIDGKFGALGVADVGKQADRYISITFLKDEYQELKIPLDMADEFVVHFMAVKKHMEAHKAEVLPVSMEE